LAAPDPLLGQRVGDYVIEERVAAGGMGVVYRAVHPLLKRKVAVKVMLPEAAQDAEHSARFVKEAQTLAALQHKGIVNVENFGRLKTGEQFMVMEWLEGETLDALLRREGKLSLSKLLPLLDQMLDALGAAHDAGVVHRDLKPSNVFLVRHASGPGYVKLVDFGLAKMEAQLRSRVPGELASIVAGTPHYISPEQAQGLKATPRSDLYSFGGMLFELLTGRLPFRGSSWAELVSAQLRREAPRLSSVLTGTPPALDALCAELLRKNPAERPASAQMVRARLKQALREVHVIDTVQAGIPVALPSPEPQPGSGGVTGSFGVERRWLGAALAGLLVAGAGIATGLYVAMREDPVPVAWVPLPRPIVAPPAPAPVAQPEPVVDPELDEKLKVAAERERIASLEQGQRKFSRKMDSLRQSGIRPGEEGAVAAAINDGLAIELEQGAHKRVTQSGTTDKRCVKDWKTAARRRVLDIRSRRIERIRVDPDGPVARERMQQLTEDVHDLERLIGEAKTPADCELAWRAVESWEKSP
jgi:tRNA A-37 threonylcarbamoyl transferase component Bud32